MCIRDRLTTAPADTVIKIKLYPLTRLLQRRIHKFIYVLCINMHMLVYEGGTLAREDFFKCEC